MRLSIIATMTLATAVVLADSPLVELSGELRQWHKVTLSLQGPAAKESDTTPNPFTDYRMEVEFTQGGRSVKVPGYFAADGNAAESSADEGNIWRAHLSPDQIGEWRYEISFTQGRMAALTGKGAPLPPCHGISGSFKIVASNKTAPDFRSKGILAYVGQRYLQFKGSKEYFLKAGADAPETLLAYQDFDGTRANSPKKCPLKSWLPHVQEWQNGDPAWKGGKGKGLIGALNYISGKGCNSISFLTYNAGGDGDNVWPFVERDDKLHYDCSKLDQWGIVFDHAVAKGVHLHFKLQENEIDDNRIGHNAKAGLVKESLDGGELGPERQLYCRELIARFGHVLALNWNIGEENTQSAEEVCAMAAYVQQLDAYDHNIVIHSFPDQQDKVYAKLLGEASPLTGASLQNSWSAVHQRTLKWINASQASNRPWVVANDEQNPASSGVPPDPDYKEKNDFDPGYTIHDIRKLTLWGNLMAGGAGVEYYFGYKLVQNDLTCEDFHSRDQSWDYCRIALEFFQQNRIPLVKMSCADELVGNEQSNNSRYCLAQTGQLYLVYLPNGGSCNLDLTGAAGSYDVKWFNPRRGGALQVGSVAMVKGGTLVKLGEAPAEPAEDWLVVIRKLAK